MNLKINLIIVVLALTIIGCGEKNQSVPKKEITKISTHKDNVIKQKALQQVEKKDDVGTLIFFLNPNGRPCKMQDKIFQDNLAQINQFAKIKYITTTKPSNRSIFNKYGIRSLPSLVLLDSHGKITKRFSPGIQQINTLLPELQRNVQ